VYNTLDWVKNTIQEINDKGYYQLREGNRKFTIPVDLTVILEEGRLIDRKERQCMLFLGSLNFYRRRADLRRGHGVL